MNMPGICREVEGKVCLSVSDIILTSVVTASVVVFVLLLFLDCRYSLSAKREGQGHELGAGTRGERYETSATPS